MNNASFVSKSIWNEHPMAYFIFKSAFSTTILPLFILANYCIIIISPKNYKRLKWFIYIHFICASIEWICNWLLIDTYDFEPSVFLRIDGILKYIIDSAVLFRMACVLECITDISALFLFYNRILLIFNMYRQRNSAVRQFLEILFYILAVIFCIWSLPSIFANMPPDQNMTKLLIMTMHQNDIIYPDCIKDAYSVVTCDPRLGSKVSGAEVTIGSWILIGVAIIILAEASYWLMDRRTKNRMSEATKKIHRKFSYRTMKQASIYVLFAVVPRIIVFLSILFGVQIYGAANLADFISENRPTACIVSLFLFYDPYQNYLLRIYKKSPENTQKSKVSSVDRAAISKIYNVT